MLRRVVLSFILATTGLALSVPEAEAARLGGSRSIGMQRQVAPRAPAAAPQQVAPSQTARPQPAAAPQPVAAQSGWRKWAGPLAGLAAGIGLAALLSHFGVGGEFAGILLAVIAVFLVIALLRRLFAGRAQPQPAYAGGVTPREQNARVEPFAARQAASETAAAAAPASVDAARIPADFDVAGFTHQAKVNFVRLQAANDSCNLDDIREFTTPEMFAEIKLAIDERGCRPQKTDVIQLDAEVLEAVEESGRYVVSVRFNGLLREEADRAPQGFDEVWHLAKPLDGSRGWVLAGIQQLN